MSYRNITSLPRGCQEGDNKKHPACRFQTANGMNSYELSEQLDANGRAFRNIGKRKGNAQRVVF